MKTTRMISRVTQININVVRLREVLCHKAGGLHAW